MKKIIELLCEQNIKKIKVLAKIFGYIDVKIYAAPKENILQFFIAEDKSTDDNYSSALTAKLIQLLQCQIAILIDTHLNKALVNALLDRCADLDNKERIEILFGKPYGTISFRDPDQDAEAEYFFSEGLALAEEILEEQKTTTERAFFDKSRQTPSLSPTENEQPQNTQKTNIFKERKESDSPKNKI